MCRLSFALTMGLVGLLPAGCLIAPAPEPEVITPPGGVTLSADGIEPVVRVPDPAGTTREVVFYGRAVESPGDDFTIVLLPDTQAYSQRFPETFLAQTQWIADQRDALNIAAVFHLGDIVETASVIAQWEVADAAFDILDAVPDLPYGLSVGNHDQTPAGDPHGTENFNRYFPARRYEALRSWYGGHFGQDNDNHYILFSAGGLDFVAIFLEYDPAADPAVLAWADGVLARHSARRGIVVTHFTMFSDLLFNQFSAQGWATYDALKHNRNLLLMLGGHFCEAGQRSDVFAGNVVQSLVADFQCRPDGGDGWLRLLEFSPAENRVSVRTYSPTRDEFLSDALNEFTFPCAMSGPAPFEELGRVTLGPGQEEARLAASGFEVRTRYEWYVAVSAESATITGPLWSFETR